MRLIYRMLSPGGERTRMPVLIFHRVLPEPDPLFPFEPDARAFARICDWLARWFQVLPLDRAIALQQQQSLPPRALAISFDDGYADNHDIAMPILRARGLSATFFIATGFLDGGCMWNDRVIAAIRHCRESELDLDPVSNDMLGRHPLGSVDARRRALMSIIQRVKYLAPEPRLVLVNRILVAAGVEMPKTLMMTSDQVRGLRDGGMQVGAHTVSHPILAGLPKTEASREIEQSRDTLQGILSERVGLFAYPNGRHATDYNDGTAALVRELGFDAAVTTNPGVVSGTTDLFQIPRFTPWESDQARFAFRLAQMMARGTSRTADA